MGLLDRAVAIAGQLAEDGIQSDSIPGHPDLDSPYERDYHRMEQVYMSGRGNFWIAWFKGQPAGHVGAQDLVNYIELRRMYVRDEYRRCGIGTQLVNTLITHSRHHGVRLIKLWTNPEGPGRLLYRKLGFREVEIAGEDGEILTDDRGEIRMHLYLSG